MTPKISASEQQPEAPNHPTHQHHLSKKERDHLGGWNGLLWLDFMNMDAGAASKLFEEERTEIENYELAENAQPSTAPASQQKPQTAAHKPRSPPKVSFVEPTNKNETTRVGKTLEAEWQEEAAYPIGPIMGD